MAEGTGEDALGNDGKSALDNNEIVSELPDKEVESGDARRRWEWPGGRNATGQAWPWLKGVTWVTDVGVDTSKCDSRGGAVREGLTGIGDRNEEIACDWSLFVKFNEISWL